MSFQGTFVQNNLSMVWWVVYYSVPPLYTFQLSARAQMDKNAWQTARMDSGSLDRWLWNIIFSYTVYFLCINGGHFLSERLHSFHIVIYLSTIFMKIKEREKEAWMDHTVWQPSWMDHCNPNWSLLFKLIQIMYSLCINDHTFARSMWITYTLWSFYHSIILERVVSKRWTHKFSFYFISRQRRAAAYYNTRWLNKTLLLLPLWSYTPTDCVQANPCMLLMNLDCHVVSVLDRHRRMSRYPCKAPDESWLSRSKCCRIDTDKCSR